MFEDRRWRSVAKALARRGIEAVAIEHAGTDDRAMVAESLRAIASGPGEVILPGEWAKAKDILSNVSEINCEGAAGN